MNQSTQRNNAHNEKAGYMSQLEAWIDEQVMNPLHQAITNGDKDAVMTAYEAVTKAIKAKMLESYRNGQSAPVKEAYANEPISSNRPIYRRAYAQKGAKSYGR